MGFFCPKCGEEQVLPPFIIIGQGPCPYCGKIVDLTNAVRDVDDALEVREKYESGDSDDEGLGY